MKARELALLAEYLEKLHWSPERLAREINRLYGQGTISSKAPYAWVKGAYPRGQLAMVVAGILSARLGETVDIATLWPQRSPERDLTGPATGIAAAPSSETYVEQAVRQFDFRPAEAVPASVSAAGLVAAGVDWLLANDRPVPTRARGQEIPPAVTEAAAVRVEQLRLLVRERGDRLAADWLTHDLRWVSRLALWGAFDRETGARLYRMIADLAQLLGWLLVDSGDRTLGRRYLLTGLRAARIAGDRDFGAYILSCLGYHMMWCGHLRDALRLIQIAGKGKGETTATVRALLASRQARVHARLGDAAACEDHFAAAAKNLARGLDEPAPPWSSWVSPAVLDADAGRALLELGHPGRAETRLSDGLRNLDRRQRRDHLLHHLSVAEARLDLREVDGAAEAGLAALEIAAEVCCGRAEIRLRKVDSRFADYDSAVARSMRDAIRQVLSSSPC